MFQTNKQKCCFKNSTYCKKLALQLNNQSLIDSNVFELSHIWMFFCRWNDIKQKLWRARCQMNSQMVTKWPKAKWFWNNQLRIHLCSILSLPPLFYIEAMFTWLLLGNQGKYTLKHRSTSDLIHWQILIFQKRSLAVLLTVVYAQPR